MAQNIKIASFEEFLEAPARIAEKGQFVMASEEPPVKPPAQQTSLPHSPDRPKKEKVGLTLDPAIVDAIDDYIYHARKEGQRLKKNDVYEAALRQFLGLDESDAR